MFDIKRIEKMEEKLNRCTSAVRALDAALADYADISGDIGELADYLSSSEWREDFEADERGSCLLI